MRQTEPEATQKFKTSTLLKLGTDLFCLIILNTSLKAVQNKLYGFSHLPRSFCSLFHKNTHRLKIYVIYLLIYFTPICCTSIDF